MAPTKPCRGCNGSGQRRNNVVSHVNGRPVTTPTLAKCGTCKGSGVAPGH